jgi:hypothetical protein
MNLKPASSQTGSPSMSLHVWLLPIQSYPEGPWHHGIGDEKPRLGGDKTDFLIFFKKKQKYENHENKS